MRIHIVSIAGAMTANIAADLVKKGNIVTGSDQENIYPPISTTLEKAGIKINSTNIDNTIELAIIGSSYDKFQRTKNEFEEIKKLNIPYISATEYIAKYIIKQNSILIAGSVGKSTTTSLVSWILTNAKYQPNTMIGAQNIDSFDSYSNTNSEWSVVEADESIHGLDTKAKFLYYPCKYLLITSSHWEHKDCYASESENQAAYQLLINNIQSDGFIAINEKDFSNNRLIFPKNLKKITYNTPTSEYYIKSTKTNFDTTTITIKTPRGEYSVNSQILGEFNLENILAAFTICQNIGIDNQTIIDSIEKYHGIKRRLEIIIKKDNSILIDDFAQSSPRITSALDAIKFHFSDYKITCIFEPHAGFLQHKSGLEGLDSAFKNASQVILSKLRINPDKDFRLTSKDYQNIIGDKLVYLPESEDIINYLRNHIDDKTIIINFSSGGIKNHLLLEQISKIL